MAKRGDSSEPVRILKDQGFARCIGFRGPVDSPSPPGQELPIEPTIFDAAPSHVTRALTLTHSTKEDKHGLRTVQGHGDDNAPQSTSSLLDWAPLEGASVAIDIPPNKERLVDVPFFAESRCVGPNTGRCVMRIIATPNGGVPIELSPVAGFDYAFDSDLPNANDDAWEGHGLERSALLSGDDDGTTWNIQVQYAVTNAATVFTLDDWHLAVITKRVNPRTSGARLAG